PFSETSPSSTVPSDLTNPVIASIKVVLPAPFGPIRPTSSPASSSRSTPATARTPPKLTDTPRARKTEVIVVVSLPLRLIDQSVLPTLTAAHRGVNWRAPQRGHRALCVPLHRRAGRPCGPPGHPRYGPVAPRDRSSGPVAHRVKTVAARWATGPQRWP